MKEFLQNSHYLKRYKDILTKLSEKGIEFKPEIGHFALFSDNITIGIIVRIKDGILSIFDLKTREYKYGQIDKFTVIPNLETIISALPYHNDKSKVENFLKFYTTYGTNEGIILSALNMLLCIKTGKWNVQGVVMPCKKSDNNDKDKKKKKSAKKS